MKALYQKLNEVKFRPLAIGLLMACDLLGCFLLYHNVSDQKAFMEGWERLQREQNLMLTEGNPANFALQIHNILIQTVLLMIIAHILFHWIIYLAYYFEKRLPYLYLKIATWFFAAFSFLGALSSLASLELEGFAFFLMGLTYFYVAYGLRLFPVSSATLKKQEQ